MDEVTEVLCKCSRMVLTGNKKKPQVTKSGPDLSRKLLYLYMLLLKSVNIVLVSHRITGTERKIMPWSRVPYDARVKVLTIQHNHWGRFFFSIQECIFGIRRIRGKMRSTVWTVRRTAPDGGSGGKATHGVSRPRSAGYRRTI